MSSVSSFPSSSASSELQDRLYLGEPAGLIRFSKEVFVLERELFDLKELVTDFQASMSDLNIPNPARAPTTVMPTQTTIIVNQSHNVRFSKWGSEIEGAVALQEWDIAVNLLEEGQLSIPGQHDELSALRSQLVACLLTSLSHSSSRKSTVVHLISLLTRLGAGAAARRTFLEMRTEVIRSLTRKIQFQGDTAAYVVQLSVVYFTGIKHTAEWYLESFKENKLASALISWTKEQLEGYAEIFKKQVYIGSADPEMVQQAVRIAQTQSTKILHRHGLDFGYLLRNLLLEKPS